MSADDEFANIARVELHRIETALAEMPVLLGKKQALLWVMRAYGFHAIPVTARAASVPIAPEGTVPLSDKTVEMLESRQDDQVEPSSRTLDRHTNRVGTPRPDGIPSNFQMTYQILKEHEDGLPGTRLIEEIRGRYWPGLTFNQIAPEFARYVKERRLTKDYAGRLKLTPKGIEIGASPNGRLPRDMSVRMQVQPRTAPPKQGAQKRVLVPRSLTPEQIELRRAEEAAKRPPPPDPATTPIAFEHNDKKVMLTPRECRLVTALYDNMGNGFMDSAHLVKICTAGDRRGVLSDRVFMEDITVTINKRIALLKLAIVPYEKLGFFMREVV